MWKGLYHAELKERAQIECVDLELAGLGLEPQFCSSPVLWRLVSR